MIEIERLGRLGRIERLGRVEDLEDLGTWRRGERIHQVCERTAS